MSGWYATMPNPARRKYFSENLKLLLDYLENNVEEELVTKCLETYSTYPTPQKGGPLFFKIMIDQLQTNSDEATQYLLGVLKNLKISTFKGEDVTVVVSLIRGAVERLSNIRNPITNTNAVPDDLVKTLLTVFQTSSVGEFNEFFRHMSISVRINQVKQGLKALPTISELLHAAESNYRELSVAAKWTGVSTKGGETAFVAGQQPQQQQRTPPICWNCDSSGHSSRDCTKPKDADKIAKNREAFQKKKQARIGPDRSDGHDVTPTGQFSPPNVDEQRGPGGQRTSGRRTIDGIPHFYKRADKRWYPVNQTAPSNPPNPQQPPQAVQAPAVPQQVLTPQGLTQSGATALSEPTSATADTQERRRQIDLALLNTNRSISQALSGLAEQFRL